MARYLLDTNILVFLITEADDEISCKINFILDDYYNQVETKTLSNLEIAVGHKDPFDHSIISHAITDKYTLISSDSKFREYEKQNLSFIYNKR